VNPTTVGPRTASATSATASRHLIFVSLTDSSIPPWRPFAGTVESVRRAVVRRIVALASFDHSLSIPIPALLQSDDSKRPESGRRDAHGDVRGDECHAPERQTRSAVGWPWGVPEYPRLDSTTQFVKSPAPGHLLSLTRG
jgi:hypothetical protein